MAVRQVPAGKPAGIGYSGPDSYRKERRPTPKPTNRNSPFATGHW